VREGGCVGVGDGVREGGYAYKDRSRVPAAHSELNAKAGDEGSYRRFRSARRNRLLAVAESTRLLSSIPSAALGSTAFRGRTEAPSFSLESSFCIQFNLDLPPEVKRYTPHPEWIERHLRSHIHLFRTNPAMLKVLTHV
jgi:hypothetical protein